MQLGLGSPQLHKCEQLARTLPLSSPACCSVVPSENRCGEGRNQPRSPGVPSEGGHPRSHVVLPPAPRSWAHSKVHFPFTSSSRYRRECDARRGEVTQRSSFRELVWGWDRCQNGRDTFHGRAPELRPTPEPPTSSQPGQVGGPCWADTHEGEMLKQHKSAWAHGLCASQTASPSLDVPV